MVPELIIVINGDENHTHILKYELDRRSAVNLVLAARSTVGLMLPGEVTGILAAALKAVEKLEPTPIQYVTEAPPERKIHLPQDVYVMSNGHPGPTLEEIARRCHEANKAYCESIGDTSQVSWDDAPAWQQQSAIDGVGFAISNEYPSPEEMHQNWMNDKTEAGWIWGETKDPNATPPTHPCIVPYHQLPANQRRKDEIFRMTVIEAMKPKA